LLVTKQVTNEGTKVSDKASFATDEALVPDNEVALAVNYRRPLSKDML
jgi:hypothetical protein